MTFYNGGSLTNTLVSKPIAPRVHESSHIEIAVRVGKELVKSNTIGNKSVYKKTE